MSVEVRINFGTGLAEIGSGLALICPVASCGFCKPTSGSRRENLFPG
jgi:hypothetical protein